MKMVLHTAGSSKGDLVCSSVDSQCGGIVNGISLQFVEYPYSFVVDFEDFEKVYFAAKGIRKGLGLSKDAFAEEEEDQ